MDVKLVYESPKRVNKKNNEKKTQKDKNKTLKEN